MTPVGEPIVHCGLHWREGREICLLYPRFHFRSLPFPSVCCLISLSSISVSLVDICNSKSKFDILTKISDNFVNIKSFVGDVSKINYKTFAVWYRDALLPPKLCRHVHVCYN